MEREKRIILVAHCVINQNCVVYPLARAKGAFSFVDTLIKNDIGIYQLPCPEFKFLGLKRKPQTKEEYDCNEFRNLCKGLTSYVMSDIKEYINNNFKIVGIIGINESPTCSISNNRGIFMEELFKALESANITIPYIEVPAEYENNSTYINKINLDIINLIENSN